MKKRTLILAASATLALAAPAGSAASSTSPDSRGAVAPKVPVTQIAGRDPLAGKDFLVHIAKKPRSAATTELVVQGRLELPRPALIPTGGWFDAIPFWNTRLMRALMAAVSS